MIINIQDNILKLHAAGLLERLLADKTTGQNILWATDAYAELGPGYGRDEPITPALITGEHLDIIKTRARKAMEQQAIRTRQRGEVATPLWVCEKMIDYADEMWFGRAAGFHKTDERGHIRFTQKQPWQKYVQTTRLEITCGEAPFLAQRYDAETGEAIPVEERGGILDRKLRAVSENAADEADWLVWAQKAVQATYGYEFQGDNLLIARVNLWMSVEEHFQYWRKAQGKRPRKLTKPEGRRLCEVVAWNLWQMDGLTGAIPYCKAEETEQFDILYLMDGLSEPEEKILPPCRLYDWERDTDVEYASLKKERWDMKFDFIIGNPPYQEDVQNQGDRANPIYDKFMDESYKLSDVVELIHPARFLFNAGQTPKAWNRKMLDDEHLKVLYYNSDPRGVFPNKEIKGGVAITLHNTRENYGAIGTFTSYIELNEIIHKVSDIVGNAPRLDSIIASQGLYRFSELFFRTYPESVDLMGKGTGNKIVSSVMVKLPQVFLDTVSNHDQYVRFLGRVKNQRVYKYIERDFLIENDYTDQYKLFIPEANNSGTYGETLTEPTVGYPTDGASDTFLCAGPFKTVEEPNNMAKYMKCRFFRALLGVKKVTQHCPPPVWKMIPLQDFTPDSDIDWSQSIAGIDRQLYAKYGLDEAEIEFIETHVKEME